MSPPLELGGVRYEHVDGEYLLQRRLHRKAGWVQLRALAVGRHLRGLLRLELRARAGRILGTDDRDGADGPHGPGKPTGFIL